MEGKKMKKYWMKCEQEASFLKDYANFFKTKRGIRKLRRLYGKRTRRAFHTKAVRLGFKTGRKAGWKVVRIPVSVAAPSTSKKIPNFYVGVAERLRTRGFTSNDIHEVLFGTKTLAKIPINIIHEMEYLLSLKGKVDVLFKVNDGKIKTEIL